MDIKIERTLQKPLQLVILSVCSDLHGREPELLPNTPVNGHTQLDHELAHSLNNVVC